LPRNKFEFNACDWLSAKCGFAPNLKTNMADGEDELLEAIEVDQKLSESQKFALYQQKGKLLLRHTEKLFVRYDISYFKLSN